MVSAATLAAPHLVDIASSRIAGLAATIPATVETLSPASRAPSGGPFDAILVDLQVPAKTATMLVEAAKGIVARQIEAGGHAARVIAFGPHVAVDRLAEAAAAGADLVVSRGELLSGLPRLLARGTVGDSPTPG